MEKKVLKDDIKDKVIDDFVVDKEKKGRYWLITYYSVDITQKVLDSNIRTISKDSTISKHIESIVGQIEIGESSGEKHIHLSITFSDSKFRPVVAFKKVLGDNININSRSISYNSYCSKDITRSEDTETLLWGIEEDDINVYERREEEEDWEDNKELEKEKEKRLALIETDIVEVKKLKGIIDKQKVIIDGLVKNKEDNKKEIDNLVGIVKTLIENKDTDKARIDQIIKDNKDKTKLLEELYEANNYLYTKLKIKKEKKTSKKKEKKTTKKKQDSSSEEKGKKKA